MQDTTEYRFNQLADLNKFIVVYPDGVGVGSNQAT